MMKIKACSADFSLKRQDKKFIKDSLCGFKKNLLSEFSLEKAREAQKIFQTINQGNPSVYLFVFGGMGGSSYLFDSLAYKKQPYKKKLYKIDKVDCQHVSHLLKKNKKELKSSHFVFISKSGKTPEVLYYKKLLKSIYSKNQISLKNKVTVLVSDLKSPLAQFAKKEQMKVVSLTEDLPGRFSVFTLSGFLQLYLQGLNPLNYLEDFSKISDSMQSFLFQQKNKKEYWFCSSSKPLEKFGVWFELVWSESLFKSHKKNSLIPSLRCSSLYKLQHAYIEELTAKQKDIAVLFFDFKKETQKQFLKTGHSLLLKQPYLLKDFLNFQNKNKRKMQNLLQSKNIPLLNIEIDFSENSLFDLIFSFYQTLFIFGDFFKVNIFKNDQVDQLKGKIVNIL